MQTTLNTLVNFNGTNGSQPITGNLIADAHGNLFGTTASGGTFNHGTVFEIAHGSGHITTVVSFNGTDGLGPVGTLTMDANGNLFGTTEFGGANGHGTVFGIAMTAHGFDSTPTTLASFNVANGDLPIGTLSIDANGNLFGTTEFGGQFGDGTVFEIAKTSLGYDPNPITLVSFNQANGQSPEGGVIADANGNLFGTTAFGGASFEGTVFELVKSGSTYTLNTLVSFNGADGALPFGSLIFDGSGDVLGTTFSGGAFDHGTVFGILNTGSGFASTPTTLASFNGTDGAGPSTGSLVIRQWQPVRRHRFWRGEQQRHGVRDPQHPLRLRPQPHYPGQLHRHQRFHPGGRSVRRRSWQPVRHDTVWRGERPRAPVSFRKKVRFFSLAPRAPSIHDPSETYADLNQNKHRSLFHEWQFPDLIDET
jgi:uncharacterized repeat protein (TIGR03803 family)